MTFPKVTISEIIDGPRPVPLRSLNRVAAVGTAKKGKYGAFLLISTDSDLDNKIGRTTHTGSVGLQAARDEGASDTAFVRVMGGARTAAGRFKVAVTAGANASTNAADSVTITITPGVGAPAVHNISVPNGSNAVQASATIISALSADPSVIAVYDASTGDIVLTSKVPGLAGNSITFSLSEGASTELTFTPATGNLSGGFDGPKAATLTVGDLQLVAAYDGVFGNTITASFIPGLTATQVIVNLVDGDLTKESFTLDFVPSSLINGNEFAALRASNMVRGFFNPAGNINAPVLPTAAGNGSLVGASDGAPVLLDQDYLDALSVLSKNQANIIFAAGSTSDAVRHALLTQATNATILGGLRIAVLNAPRAIDTVSAAAGTYTLGYDISTADYGGSAVMVAGWATYAGQPTLAELSVSPDGFYAGHLSATAPYISPAARSSSPYYRSIIAVDTDRTDVAFDAYTTGRLEAIILDPATGGFHCLNGRTISSDSAEYYVSIRRMANQIKTDLWFASQPLKSEPKTDGLVASIANMVTSYLSNKINIGQLKGGSVLGTTKGSSSIRLDFQWYPIYPADQIDYGMHRLAVDI